MNCRGGKKRGSINLSPKKGSKIRKKGKEKPKTQAVKGERSVTKKEELKKKRPHIKQRRGGFTSRRGKHERTARRRKNYGYQRPPGREPYFFRRGEIATEKKGGIRRPRRTAVATKKTTRGMALSKKVKFSH